MSFTQDIHRAYEIATILIQYGFGDIVQRLGMNRVLTEAGKLLKWQSMEETVKLSAYERVRRALEELGPTFIKMGQIMATRVDLFPPGLIAELEKLQSQTKPVEFVLIKEQVEEDLGMSIEEAFSEFVETPAGSASMAQVHFAKLKDGTPVVVKVRRPNIRRVVEADLRLIGHMAQLAEKELLDLKHYKPAATAEQFSMSMLAELNFIEEGRHADRARSYLREDSKLKIPKIYWEYTCERMNIQERVVGIPGFNVDELRERGGDPQGIARDGAQTISAMIVEDGFFHADPHPGNIFYLENHEYVLIDWGMVGRLTEVRRDQIIDLLMGVVRRNIERIREILLDWAVGNEEEVDSERLTIYIEEFLDKYHDVPLDKLEMANVFHDLTKLLRDNRISLPPDLALVFKVFITLEGLGRRLDPTFNLTTEAQPILEMAIRRRYRPEEIFKRGKRMLADTFDLLIGLPKDFRIMTRAIKAGQVKMNVEIRGLEDFGQRIDDSASRISTSLVTAAFILSTSIVMSVGDSPKVYGLPFFDILGYGAMIGGLFVLFSILRANRQRRRRRK